MKETKAASDASAETLVPRPLSSAWNASLTEALASSPALCALLVLTPASVSQVCILSTALWRLFCSSGIWLVTPDSSSTAMSTATASTPRRTIAAPPPRPSLCRASQPTTGERTAAMIVAVITGMTIVAVRERNQITPPSRSSVPTTSHDISPRSRSHEGTAKTRESWPGSISTKVAAASGAAPS